MNHSSWQNCFQCGSALGTCTAVQGGSPYDQFSTFRSSSLAAIVSNSGSNCSWVTNTVMTFGTAQYPVQLVTCDYPAGLLSVVLQLNATAFGIIPTKTTLSLVNSGQYVWPSGSLTGESCVRSLIVVEKTKPGAGIKQVASTLQPPALTICCWTWRYVHAITLLAFIEEHTSIKFCKDRCCVGQQAASVFKLDKCRVVKR